MLPDCKLCGGPSCGMQLYPHQEGVPEMEKRGFPICARWPDCCLEPGDVKPAGKSFYDLTAEEGPARDPLALDIRVAELERRVRGLVGPLERRMANLEQAGKEAEHRRIEAP